MPANRVVAFVGPYVSIAAGALSTWLMLHVHVIGALGFAHNQVASAVAYVATFAVTTGVTWAGHQKWLTGWQQWAGREAQPVGYIGAPSIAPDDPATIPPDVGDAGAAGATVPPPPTTGAAASFNVTVPPQAAP